jgi:catechol 2,3-dioxygenase-like lactoylglutathione lyase family enzyme
MSPGSEIGAATTALPTITTALAGASGGASTGWTQHAHRRHDGLQASCAASPVPIAQSSSWMSTRAPLRLKRSTAQTSVSISRRIRVVLLISDSAPSRRRTRIAPQFFTTEIAATLAYYKDKLGFDCLGTWDDPPVYAIVARDEHRIHFRLADPPRPNPDKYAGELLDAYLFIQDADALYAEYLARGVEFTRAVGDTAWHSREFVVKGCDGRLLAFGADH